MHLTDKQYILGCLLKDNGTWNIGESLGELDPTTNVGGVRMYDICLQVQLNM
jgi:hypothetical protein